MEENRRPIRTRSAGWALLVSRYLASKHITPNQISVASIVFALLGAVALVYAGTAGLLIAVLCIQLRLLCNLFDGMVAIEGGHQTTLGVLYNEFPDRIADTLLLVAMGYCADVAALGWFAALAAALTAYVRVFGGALGLTQVFCGPMAKQHRMAIMTGCLAGACVQSGWGGTWPILQTGLIVIAAGSVLTCLTRTLRIARQLNGADHADQ